MNESENTIRTPERPWIRQNWPFLLGIILAFSWLVIAVAHLFLITSQDATIESGNYRSYHRYVDTACMTSISGVVLAIFIFIVWVFKKEAILDFGASPKDWHKEKVSDRTRTFSILLMIAVFLFASIFSGFIVFVSAFLNRSPELLQTVELKGYTYHLAHRPTSDWDANEILLYECNRPYTDCHLIHEEFTRNLDGLGLRADPEENRVFLMIYDRVVFEHQPPSD